MTSKPTDEKSASERPRRSTATTASTRSIAENRRAEQYDDIVGAAKELFLEKNEQYGDAIAETGVLGAVVQIVGLNARLKKIVLASSDAGKSQEEALKDIIKDSLNYAAIAGIMIMDSNWRPE